MLHFFKMSRITSKTYTYLVSVSMWGLLMIVKSKEKY